MLPALLLALPATAFALSEQSADFDQIAALNGLGGSVTQVGGGAPGSVLLVSTDFVGPVDSQSGVSVVLPGYVFVASVPSFDDGGAGEPGNLASLLIGTPTDLTFTTPGAGGPDGSDGDGSIKILAGGHVTFDFGTTVAGQLGSSADLVILTNTASGGTALIELLDATLATALASLTTTIPGGTAGSGQGGLILDVQDGQLYGGLRITGQSGSLELDAVAAAFVPEVCGNGVVEAGEQCDDGALLDGDCCSSSCQFEPAGTLCRGAVAACDAAEVCSGTSGSCPADGVLPVGSECRAAAGACDVPETCDGLAAACPADQKSVAECRPSAGVCDAAEFCDGLGDACPADALLPAGEPCRDAVGACDVAEVCDGALPACPADGLAAAGSLCRPASDLCDAPETCDGLSGLCPVDVLASAGTLCRPAVAACDAEEACTGLVAACPPDQLLPDGSSCDMNVCTLDQCVAGVCEIAPWPETAPPPADFIFVIDATESMRRDFKRWLPDQLRTFPAALAQAGIDYRLAIVRYGTSRNTGNPRTGPPTPDVLLPCTGDPLVFEAALDALVSNLRGCSSDPGSPERLNCIRRKTEAGSEAIRFALSDEAMLNCRGPEARRNVILYTDEDDDSPVLDEGSGQLNSGERREPPARGRGCYGRRCQEAWLPFQQRTDDVAALLIAQQAQINIIENPRNRPSTHQYGDPGCTRLDAGGRLDPGATLACLLAPDRRGSSAQGICDLGTGACSQGRVGQSCSADPDCDAHSLQSHLLSIGRCGPGGLCSAGTVGSVCNDDADCAILARAYPIPTNPSQAAAFFQQELIPDKVAEQFCAAP